ncbi:protein vreteno-like [Glossina fuscipes]|uniref:Protein vreteno-like n=1 Tax=Glossina fuscipes TaxID=7396 RepID=A0A9C5ZI70_9MUSC|nr:protein vreteno-like [Glossina fuscipes]
MEGAEEFGEWNEMKKDYTNAELNQYVSETGGNLDDGFQPNLNKKVAPYLVFKNVPKEMTKLGLINICSKYGVVKGVRCYNKTNWYFVDFATVADAEAVCRNLECSDYGFQVVVGKKKDKTIAQIPVEDKPPLSTRTSYIDQLNRTYRISEKLHPRSHFQPSQLLVDSNLQTGFIFNDDAHALERQGLKNKKSQTNKNIEYYTGRAYMCMPDQIRNFVENKSKKSLGIYCETSETYSNSEFVEKTPPSRINKCTLCKLDCDAVCTRCRAYYCSVQCQKKDWDKHRRICGRPKLLQVRRTIEAGDNNQNCTMLKENIEEQEKYDVCEITKNIPQSDNVVTITTIAKTNVVFIRSKVSDDIENFFKTVNHLQKLSKTLKTVTKRPRCGEILINKFYDEFCRVMVLNHIGAEDVVVVYVDYGNVDILSFKHLYETPEDYIRIPFHAIPVILKEVPDCYMTEEIRNFMYSYLNDINVCLKYEPEDFISDKGVYMVEIIDERNQQNFNKSIKKLAIPREPVNSNEICTKDYVQHVPLPSGDNIELVVMDNSLMHIALISCTLKLYALEIQKFNRDLQKYAQNSSTTCYAPRINELCIAKYSVDGKWYRGCCLELVGDGHPTIMFIDYGNIAYVGINNIRPYPVQFTFPIYTSDCEIEGLPEKCDEKLVKKLEEFIPNGTAIKCGQVKPYESDSFHILSLPHIISKLNSLGLLQNANES